MKDKVVEGWMNTVFQFKKKNKTTTKQHLAMLKYST